MTNIKTIDELDQIGFFGPFILIFINIYNLLSQPYYLIGYLVTLLMNSGVNKILKGIIREPRPEDSINITNLEVHNGADIYGMPSGHSQSVSFSTVFVYLVQKSTWLLLLNTIILMLTILQRWNYRKHTMVQLVAGSIVGVLVGSISYLTIKKMIETPAMNKRELTE